MQKQCTGQVNRQMNIIYNKEKKIIICAMPRCGSNYIAHIGPHFGYKFLEQYTEDEIKDYTVVKLVRDPVNRFVSWWYSFKGNLSAVDDDPRSWSQEDADAWIEMFKTYMHYDEHTCLQSIMYSKDKSLNHNNVFVKMEDVNILLGLSSEPHTVNTYSELIVNNTPIINRVLEYANIFYKQDIEWYNKLDKTIPASLIPG